MANIALRSPQYKFTSTTGSTLSTVTTITIDGTLRYTIVKNNPSSNTGTNVDISELSRDYLINEYKSGGQPQNITISTVMKNFPALNGGGTQIGNTITHNDVGYQAYGLYFEGANPEIVDTTHRALPTWLVAANNLANPPDEVFEVFLPLSQTMRLTGIKSDGNLYFGFVSGSATSIPAVANQNPLMKVTRIGCTKYGTGIKIVFVNKYGIQQDLWFFLKNIDRLNRSNETYNSNTLSTQSNAAASYNKQNAPRKVFNTIAKQSFTLSSGYYPEFATQYFEQLIMSEYVWMEQENIEKRGSFEIMPVVVKTSSVTQKTSVNDRLIEYTIEFELAADYINNIRMQKLQLYIQGVRVDLFKDETVSLTQTIQNVKDINKIFTEFSKTFSLPASPTNNKIFKHYYNFDIQAGFDARNKVSASLELNTIPFKDGFIRLEGVNLKNNVAHTYRVTFFGNTINLNDVLGATQLSGLSGLSSDNLTYTSASVLSKLRNPPTGNICCPLITHSQRLIFDPATNKQELGNLAWQGSTSDNGVLFSDLKYAIRLQRIVAAIQSQVYENEQSITFSNDFFNNTSNTAFYNLWMWLHRKKGGVESTVQLQLNFTQLNDLVTTFGNLPSVSTAANGTLTLGVLSGSDVYVSTSLELTPTSNTVEYSVRVSRNGADVAQLNNVTGPQTLFNSPQTALGAGTYAVLIASTTGVTFAATNIEWEITVVNTQPGQGSGGGTQTLSNSSIFQNQSDVQFVISEQIPEMTIIDFLTSIFRMFNLTAFVNNAGVIVVKTLDSYYAAGASDPIVIDQYVDVTKSTVDIALPFREVVYRFKGINTFLAKQYNQVNNLEWGSLKYTLDEDIYDAPTNTYKVEIPFEHVLYERIFPTASTTPTSVQYGYFVDDNQEPYFGLPLIFYAIRIPSGTAISFKGALNTNIQITQYIIPSNSKELLASTSTTNINFGQMINEYTPNDVFSGTLFANYYNTYISEVFNRNKRLTKVTAYLPLKIYHNLELNSKMQINLQNYKINSITTNLTNGKSEIELLNVT